MAEATAKQPQQERGQRRVTRILDAAEQEILRAGVDGMTMNAVAQRAATAPGSLYQFFPGKSALIAALSQRHVVALAALAKETSDLLMQHPEADIGATAIALLQPFVRYYAAHPAYVILAAAAHRWPETLAGEDMADDAVVQAYVKTLMPFAGAHASGRLELAARLMVETGHAAIAASQTEDPGEKDAWIAELQLLVAAYASTLR
jgi:AcrR family transcriptional regulator